MKLSLIFFLFSIPLFANMAEHIYSNGIEFSLIIALFLLATIGIVALYISSVQIKNLKKQHILMQNNQDDIVKRHDKLLADMSQHIKSMAKETIFNTRELAKQTNQSNYKKILYTENKLLGITSDLIEFLRLKSKKIEIKDEPYKLINLLNDTSGSLISKYSDKNIELNYDIKCDIPDTIIGDTLNLNKVLVNILEFSIKNDASRLMLKIYKTTKLTSGSKLNFIIQTNLNKDLKKNKDLFTSKYNEDMKRYDSLDLFVAKELSLLMKGDLIAKNDKDGYLNFTLQIPFKSKKENQIKLPKEVVDKKVYIVDANSIVTSTIERIFLNLNYDVKSETLENFILNKHNFLDYDIVVIDRKLINRESMKTLNRNLTKVIAIGNMFDIQQIKAEDIGCDVDLNKPITRDRIIDIIQELFNQNQTTQPSKKLLIHRDVFADSKNITLENFNEFNESKILLVEDNLINQKVLTSVLAKSKIKVEIANNGVEALEILHKDETFNLVLMDINMPIMDGFSATKKIREESKFDLLPIISLTALTSNEEIDKMFNSGMNGFLTKPFQKEKLFTVFNIFIKNKQIYKRRASDREGSKEALNCLNTREGVTNTDNNLIFYKEVLNEFKDAYGDTASTFEKLVQEQRFEQLRMLCLDLKGLSGTIGAKNMQDLSTEILQFIIFKKYDILPNYIKKYNDELIKLNTTIDKFLK